MSQRDTNPGLPGHRREQTATRGPNPDLLLSPETRSEAVKIYTNRRLLHAIY